MAEQQTTVYHPSVEIAVVTREIVKLCKPEKIYLYNQRVGLRGETKSFKLCIVADTGDSRALEKEIYVKVDCEVSFDVLLYTPAQWREISARPDTFAHHILQTGHRIYG